MGTLFLFQQRYTRRQVINIVQYVPHELGNKKRAGDHHHPEVIHGRRPLAFATVIEFQGFCQFASAYLHDDDQEEYAQGEADDVKNALGLGGDLQVKNVDIDVRSLLLSISAAEGCDIAEQKQRHVVGPDGGAVQDVASEYFKGDDAGQ